MKSQDRAELSLRLLTDLHLEAERSAGKNKSHLGVRERQGLLCRVPGLFPTVATHVLPVGPGVAAQVFPGNLSENTRCFIVNKNFY